MKAPAVAVIALLSCSPAPTVPVDKCNVAGANYEVTCSELAGELCAPFPSQRVEVYKDGTVNVPGISVCTSFTDENSCSVSVSGCTLASGFAGTFSFKASFSTDGDTLQATVRQDTTGCTYECTGTKQ